MRSIANGMAIGWWITRVRINFVASKDDGALIMNEIRMCPRDAERSGRTVRNKYTLDLFVALGAHIDRLQSLVTPGTACLCIASVGGIIDLNFLR